MAAGQQVPPICGKTTDAHCYTGGLLGQIGRTNAEPSENDPSVLNPASLGSRVVICQTQIYYDTSPLGGATTLAWSRRTCATSCFIESGDARVSRRNLVVVDDECTCSSARPQTAQLWL